MGQASISKTGAQAGLYWSTNPGHDVKFFLGLSWRQPTVELMGRGDLNLCFMLLI
jgi:hypothetical protein